jgi:hypothetical protein
LKNHFLTKKIDLLESYRYDFLVRQIIKDIVQIYKKESEGEFNLPFDIDEEKDEYEFKDIFVSVELILEESDSVDDFLTNADFYPDEDIIVVKIIYNPKFKTKNIYNMIGELNELIAHELRHSHQKNTGLFDLDSDMDSDEEKGFEYYTRPEEIDAQYYGFKRMSKITKKPFEDLVRNWFKKYTNIHQMDDSETEETISMILNHKN